MTDEEHQLHVIMLAQLYERIVALTEALISKGILERDDIAAYEELVHSHTDDSRRRFQQIMKQYQDYAVSLGVRDALTDKYRKPDGTQDY